MDCEVYSLIFVESAVSDVKMTEPIKQAVAWIAENQRDKPGRPLPTVLDEAAMRFDLGPQEWQFLCRFFANPECPESEAS